MVSFDGLDSKINGAGVWMNWKIIIIIIMLTFDLLSSCHQTTTKMTSSAMSVQNLISTPASIRRWSAMLICVQYIFFYLS